MNTHNEKGNNVNTLTLKMVVQAMPEKLNVEQLHALAQAFDPELYELALNTYAWPGDVQRVCRGIIMQALGLGKNHVVEDDNGDPANHVEFDCER